jgi:8-oxo-dGTP pyrophosphatase MutT (NUDIX family)
MAHIHTDSAQHDLTTSAYVIFEEAGKKPRMWFHEHRILRQWLQFGGHVELHENPWDTVIHELLEESGYEINQMQILQPAMRPPKMAGVVVHPQPAVVLTHPFPGADHFHIDIGNAFVTSEMPLHKVAEGESDTMRLMDLDEIKALTAKDIPTNVRETAIYILEEIYPTWEKVACENY